MKGKNQQLFESIDELLNTYCEGCLLFNYHVKEYGRRGAHNFCIHTCTVGQKLKGIGKELS